MAQPSVSPFPWSLLHPFPPHWLQEGMGAGFGDGQKQEGTQSGEGVVGKNEPRTRSIV